jgi:hypothetical protein
VTDLKERIAGLSDDEALDAAGCLAGWMSEDAKEKLPLDVRETIEDEQAAMGLLGEAFPEVAGRLREISKDEGRKGQAARNLLLFLAERDSYSSQVEEALNRPALKFVEPVSMNLGMVIFLLLLSDIEVRYEETKEGKRLHVSKKAPVPEILKKFLGL